MYVALRAPRREGGARQPPRRIRSAARGPSGCRATRGAAFRGGYAARRLGKGVGRPGNRGKGRGMEHRRLGRLGSENSVLIFGGAALAEATEEDTAIQQALDAGVDLFQLHSVGDIEDLDRATGPGGSLEAAIEARDEGLVGAIGITGHGNEAPATHLEALRRYPFETVLTPWNYILSTDEGYRADYEALVEEVRRQDAGLMIIKTISRRNWPEGDPTGDQRYTTWYEPFDRQEYIDAAVSWVLSHDEVTGLAMVGDVTLVPMMLEAENRRVSREEAEQVLSRAPDYSSPFISIPF